MKKVVTEVAPAAQQDRVMGRAQLQSDSVPVEPPTFSEIYEVHFNHVWHTLRRLGVHERDLEDSCHELFIVVHRRLSDFDASRRVKPWLTGIAYRVASDYRRRARHRREIVKDDIAAVDHRRSPEDDASATEARALVMRGLEEVPLDQRIVFIMHDINKVSIPEIAAELDVSPNTLYSRLRLAREKFTAAVRAAVEVDDVR